MIRRIYRHTQVGTLILALVGIIFLPMAIFFKGPPGVLALLFILFLGVGLLFGTLTVEVDSNAVTCWFGLGLIRRKIDLREVRDVQAVRNRWYYGWGVRYIGNGWMFNVSGLDAVELLLDSGKRFRIGTDQPEALRNAIRRAAAGVS